MIKKSLLVWLLLISGVLLAACGAKSFTVTFDSQGGTSVPAVEVEEDALVTEPTAPTREGVDGKAYSFTGWFTDEAATSAFDFETPITEDITLYAGWTLNVVVSFDTKTSETLNPVLLGEDGGTVTTAPTPTRDGYEFGGWFFGRPGLTWLEPTAIEFPLEVTESTTLYAYWEPIDSKAVNYSKGETYTTSLTSDNSLLLNPLEYEWSHEDDLIDMMATPLYSTEVDWDKAIAAGVADAPGDFSKIVAREFSVESLDYHNILVGATRFPVDSEGDEHLTQDGKYDRDAAATFKDTEWTYYLRDDVVFEDGTPVTAHTYEYTLQQYLSGLQNNYRANLYYKTEANQNGYPIVNAYEFFSGDVTWDQVGFEVIDDYTFKVTTSESVSQSQAVGFGAIRLVHPDAYADSLTADGTNSTYGTPDSPYVSYGAYIIKSWDENQKIVMNKNYDYVLKGTINYKSQVIQIVDDVDQRMQLFEQGDLSVAGLSQEYYADYAEDPNVYKSWDGYPQYLIINLAESKITEGGHEHPEILFDARFRQALLYGFDRLYYANNVYAPNTASLLPIPLDTKSYNQDALYYSESPNHLQVLQDLGIDPSTEGYLPDRAESLFTAAYNDWIADGNTGPVVVKYITDNDEFSMNLATYIEDSYEELFGADKLDINVVAQEPTANRQAIRDWDFDISLNSVGFGSSTGVWWQYSAIAFLGDFIGGGALGLSQPYDASQPLDPVYEANLGAYFNQEIEIDLTATYEYLEELGEDYMVSEELEGHLAMYNMLKESTDPDTSEVKPAGIYKGSFYDIAIIHIMQDTPYDGVAAEPFPGATADTWALVAAFEELFFEHVTMIPTVTRSSAIVYADNVVIEWPAYSSAFGWGSGRYRYLNTDPDFADR